MIAEFASRASVVIAEVTPASGSVDRTTRRSVDAGRSFCAAGR
jgi:hypothetical protein